MENVVPLSPAKDLFIFAHWGSCREILEYLNTTCTSSPTLISDDVKWSSKLRALGMAQGPFPMECITSAKFRVFLAERAINYLFLANVKANILLTNTNIGCPNISFGSSISSTHL